MVSSVGVVRCRWSRFTRWTIFAAILVLLVLSFDQVEAGKKKKKKKAEPAAAAAAGADADDVDIAAAIAKKKQNTHINTDTDVHINTLNDTPTPTPTPTPAATQPEQVNDEETLSSTRAARAKAASLRAKRADKRAKAVATRQAKARHENKHLSSVRRSRAEQIAAYHARQQNKLDKSNKAKIAADNPENRKKGEEKLKWMNREAGRSSTRVIQMDESSFRQYVNDGPRPYWVFLVFTSLLQQKPVCMQCHDAYSQYVPVAIAHHEYRRNMATATTPALYFDYNNTHEAADEHNMPVFFVQVEASRAGKLFEMLRLPGVPQVMMVPPRASPSSSDVRQFLSQLQPRHRYQLNQPRFESSGFNSWINKHAGILVNLDEKQVNTGDVLMGGLMLIGVGVLVYLYATGRIVIKVKRHSFVMIAWFGYMYCISGGMYNIIRGTQWAQYEEGGKVSYIHPQFRDQHSSEGFMMGLLQIVCGLMLTVLVCRAFESSLDASSSTTIGTSTSTSTSSSSITDKSARKQWYHHVGTLVNDALSPSACVFIGLASWWQLNQVYRHKSYG